jgi:hypothetical protein
MLCEQAVAAEIASTRIQIAGLPFFPLFSLNSAWGKRLYMKLFFYFKLKSQVPQISPTSFINKNSAYLTTTLPDIYYYINANIFNRENRKVTAVCQY